MRNNCLALLIHAIIGVPASLLIDYYYNKSSFWGFIAAILIAFLAYFILGYLFARLDYFDVKKKKIGNVLLPSIVLFIFTAYAELSYTLQSAGHALPGIVAKITGVLAVPFGQPAGAVLRLDSQSVSMLISAILVCALPSLLIWFGFDVAVKAERDFEDLKNKIGYK